MIDQLAINNFYINQQPLNNSIEQLGSLPKSGLALVDKILPTESVIDVGCGRNLFKNFIPNLIGIDPVFDEADFKIDLQNFTTDAKFNVALCLGSIQYGNITDIENQIQHVVNLLTPVARIYWRFNIDPLPGGVTRIGKYTWTIDNVYTFAEKFGFTVVACEYETLDKPTVTKLYAEWART